LDMGKNCSSDGKQNLVDGAVRLETNCRIFTMRKSPRSSAEDIV